MDNVQYYKMQGCVEILKLRNPLHANKMRTRNIGHVRNSFKKQAMVTSSQNARR
jgi:hypothetical protein